MVFRLKNVAYVLGAARLPLIVHECEAEGLRAAGYRVLSAVPTPAPLLTTKPTESLAQRAERLRRLANKGRKRAW